MGKWRAKEEQESKYSPSSSFFRASITMIPKLLKITISKKITKNKQPNKRTL